jgi:uncharacterized protein (DUF433 family)
LPVARRRDPLACGPVLGELALYNIKGIITLESDRRGGKPCVRGMRITVYHVLEYLAPGTTHQEILDDFLYLTERDIRASLGFTKARERSIAAVPP